MPRFSLKHLLLSTTLVAVGLVLLLLIFREPGGSLGDSAAIVCWFGGGALIGAGLLAPFRKWWIGAAIGMGIQLLVLYYIMSTLRFL
jgi:hypothetical protein